MSFRKFENDISEVRFDEVLRSKVAGATSRCNFWAPQTGKRKAAKSEFQIIHEADASEKGRAQKEK